MKTHFLFLLAVPFLFDPSTLTAQFGNTNEDQVRACEQDCLAWNDRPGWELKACLAKCQELGRP